MLCIGVAFGESWRPSIGQVFEARRISEPIATELEITELADREMKKPGGGKALLIEKPTVNGQVIPISRLAINTLGSWKRMAMSLGADSVDEVAAELGSLMKAKPPTGFRESHQTARHGPGSAPRQTEDRQRRSLQRGHPQIRSAAYPNRALADSACD